MERGRTWLASLLSRRSNLGYDLDPAALPPQSAAQGKEAAAPQVSAQI